MSEKKTMRELYAFVGEDERGEGVVAYPFGEFLMPLIAADEERIEALRPYAEFIARVRCQPVRLIKFTTRENLEDYLP